MYDIIDRDYIDGSLTIVILDMETGKIVKKMQCKNIVTYDATTCLAHLYSGSDEYKISYMYGEHADPGTSGYIEGSLNGLTTNRLDDVSIMRTSPRSTTNAESRIIYPGYSTSDDLLYDKNVVTFTASFNDSALNGRIFVGAGLIARPSSTEILCNHAYFPGYIKQASHEIIIHWSVSFR